MDLNNNDLDYIYSDIRLLHNHLKVTDAYDELRSDKDFVAVAISSVPDIASLEFLIKKFTKIYFRKEVLTSRKAHQLMFEYGLYSVNKEFIDIIKIRKIIEQIDLCTAGNLKNTKFDIERVLYPQGFQYVGKSLKVFVTSKQLDILKNLKSDLGLRTEGVAALMCVVLCMNGVYKNMDPTYENVVDLKKLDISKEWWSDCDSGVIQQVRKYVDQYKNDNLKRLRREYDYLKVELRRYNEGKRITLDKKRFDHIAEIISDIENNGLLIMLINDVN